MDGLRSPRIPLKRNVGASHYLLESKKCYRRVATVISHLVDLLFGCSPEASYVSHGGGRFADARRQIERPVNSPPGKAT